MKPKRTGSRDGFGGEVFKEAVPVFSLEEACVLFKMISSCYVRFILCFYTPLIRWSPAKMGCETAKRGRGSAGALLSQ